MKLLKKIKKGFTLVELVVVIAVVAILSAVSAITYVSITNKAANSNDESLLKQMNTAIAMRKADGEVNNMTDALNALEEELGVSDVEALLKATYKENVFLFDSTTKEFILSKQDSLPTEEKANYFRTVATKAEAEASEYSVYLSKNFEKKVPKLTVKAGIDVGVNSIPEIEYLHTSGVQDVIIRTNGGDLSVNAPNDDVDFYGTAEKLNVTAVKSNSLHLFGLAHELSLTAGHVEVKQTGLILKVMSCGENATITNNGHISSVANDSLKSKISGKEPSTETIISNKGELIAFANRVNGNGVEAHDFAEQTVQLSANIELTEGWTPIGDATHNFAGTFNGNGHTIKGLKNPDTDKCAYVKNNEYAFGFFGFLKEGGLISNVKFENVEINSGAKHVGTLLGLLSGCRNFDNITVGTKGDNSSVTITSGKGGGIIGRINQPTGVLNATTIISNCTNYATVVSSKDAAAGIVGFINLSADYGNILATFNEFSFTNCVNHGDITINSNSDGHGAVAGIYTCNSDTFMPRLGVRKTDGSYKKNGISQNVYYENNCYNFGTITSHGGGDSKACNLIGNTSSGDDDYINVFGDSWYSKTVRKVGKADGGTTDEEKKHFIPANYDTFIPTETGTLDTEVTGIDCGISNEFTYNGNTWYIHYSNNTLTVTNSK